ncbi:DUF3987 domain-containing protein [Streptomyces sp. NPDC058274]|uniref:DUF3987 domain-containing protein n=1 Tax=Streptomyces sp. NPDC058274 TaxID=3346416 RepID=UPI0036E699E7
MADFEQMAHGILGEAVKGIMPTSEADPIGVWATSLSLFSSAISHVVRTDDKRPVVVWTVLAGRSSLGRKGSALTTSLALMNKSIGGYIYGRRRKGVANGPALLDMLSQMEQENTTPDGSSDGRCVLIEDEWASLLKDQKKCSKFSGYFRMAWDGEAITNRTKKEGLQSVAQPLLGFTAHITPGEWAKYISSSDALGGTYNRLLPVRVEKSKNLPRKAPKNVVPEAEALALREAYEWACETKRVLSFSDDAADRYDEIRAMAEDRLAALPELVASYMERTPEQVQRVAAVLAALDMTEEITVEHVDKAWAFVEHSMNSVERLVREAADGVGPRPLKTPEELIREVVEKNGGETNSSTLLRALSGRGLNADLIRETAEGMDDMQVEKVKTGKRGAPSIVYRLIEPPKPTLTIIRGERQGPAPAPAPEPQPAPKPTLLAAFASLL